MQLTDIKSEFRRKLIHLSSLIYPIIYCYTSKLTFSIILVSIFIIMTTIDILRIYTNSNLIKYINQLFFRHSEENRMSGGFFFILSCLIGLILFSKYVFILSLVILTISDTSAALVGIKFGRHKILGKSIEGFLAFFISGMLVVIVMNFVFLHNIYSVYISIIALFMASLAELIAKTIRLDDNLTIVLVFGLTYEILYTIFSSH